MTEHTAWSSEPRRDDAEDAAPASGRMAERARSHRSGRLPSRMTGPWRLMWSAIWLVFLGYPVGDIVSRHHSATWVISAWAALAIFAALYLRVMWVASSATPRDDRPPPAGWLAVLICVTLGTVVMFGRPWAGVIIYLGVAVGSTLPARSALVTVAALVAFAAAFGLLVDERTSTVAFACFLTTALGVSMLGFRRLLQLIVELEQARDDAARLTAAEERLRFARDLHDVLGHSLSVVALKSQVARRTMTSDADAASAALADVESVARQSLSDVRQLVSGYRQQSLAGELASADELLAAAGITLHIDRPPSCPPAT